MTTWSERLAARLDAIRAAKQWRSVRTVDGTGPAFVVAGRDVVSFASNDYLGLAHHPAVRRAAHDALDRWGTGSGASRLVVGGRPVHDELEAALAQWKATERALLFPTGYATNVGVIAGLADAPDVLVVSDEMNHASIVDGCRQARGRVAVARHADVGHVEALLAAHAGPAIVVTDTVFSMDGDVAPLAGLVEACASHDALLVVDEAHAVLGPELPAVPDGVVVVRVGTLSKTLGSLGGFVAGPAPVVDLLLNTARPFIFTTAPAPADCAAALAALGVLRSDEGAALVRALRRTVDRVAGAGHPSPIVPLVVGDEEAALKASASLLEAGLLVPAIRPPTVPPGTSRLRIALSAASSPRSPACCDPRPVRRHVHRRRQDLGRGRRPRRAATPGRSGVGPQAGPELRPRGGRPRRRRRAVGRHRRGPGAGLPARAVVPGPHGAADGGRGPRPALPEHRRAGRRPVVADGSGS
jgi:8-amino-7-oxononanoate synthase